MFKIIIPSLTILIFGLSMVNTAFGLIDIGIQSQVGDVSIKTLAIDRTKTVVGWIYTVFFMLAVVFILMAAFSYLTAGGDATKVEAAKNQLIYAAVAVAVALLALTFDTMIANFLKTGT